MVSVEGPITIFRVRVINVQMISFQKNSDYLRLLADPQV